MAKKYPFLSASKLRIGCAYYPEQWPEANWVEDIRLMKEAGFNTVRLGDFAWSAIEPKEGEFDFHLVGTRD